MSVAYFLITLFVLIPICTLLHELGHAVPQLLLAKDVVTVHVGAGPALIHLSTKRLILHLHIASGHVGYVNSNSNISDKSKMTQLCEYIGGPLVSLLIASTSFIVIFIYPPQNFL